MSYQLVVIEGADEGRRFDVGAGEVLIGRGPSASIALKDESISYEHAIVRVEDGKLFLQNLSALGTTVRGRKVSEETRLTANDQIELSSKCRIVVEMSEGGTVPNKALLGVAAVLVLILVLGAAAVLLGGRGGGAPPMTSAHWRTAYAQIGARLDTWAAEGRVPSDLSRMFREAWRREQADNDRVAAGSWEGLNSALLSLPSPLEDDEGRTFGELASRNGEALKVIMGWSQTANQSDLQWSTDAAYADALVWFVRLRAKTTRTRAGDE
ncbi:MAG: FHA domain-containing protein [Phycisphaerales bacterium]